MLSSLAKYLLGDGSNDAQESRGNSNSDNRYTSLPVQETRLSQVEVENDDWILIDRVVEGATALEESWYVTPPACFTRAGPVHVETSPLEDLLIEHPSMSVYRAAAPLVVPDTPPPTPDAVDNEKEHDVVVVVVNNSNNNNVVGDANALPVALENRGRRRHGEREILRETPRRTADVHHDHRSVRSEETSRFAQLQSAQKVLQKRAAQTLKRGRLEKGNKVREVASGKGKRPRRQDRLRLQNSGVNNNRKC